MELFTLYVQYLSEICEGQRSAPAGVVIPEGNPEEKAVAVQQAAMDMGIPAFVKACAAAEGRDVPQEWYDSFDMEQIMQMAQQIGQMQASQPPVEAEAPEQEDNTPKIEEPDGPRHACEVLLDCCLLDDNLFSYLMEVLKTEDGLGFFRLSQVTARTEIKMEDFLIWLGNKEMDASEEERACVAIMDACLLRLAQEKENELLAALISGDQTTFEIFRCEAPELQQLPDATFEWYCRNYLDRYYPVRIMMKLHGVQFPVWRG